MVQDLLQRAAEPSPKEVNQKDGGDVLEVEIGRAKICPRPLNCF